MKSAIKVLIFAGVLLVLIAGICLGISLFNDQTPELTDKTVIYSYLQDGDYIYTVFSDYTCEITDYLGEDNKLTIPNKINGCSVVSIGDHAFENCSCTSIFIPDTVLTIGNSAFSKSLNLKKVRISRFVTSIQDYAFYCCNKLERFKMWNHVEYLGSYAFSGCRSLKSIRLSRALKSIENNTFSYCVSLKQVNIDKNITEIKENAFLDCESLQKIKIPDSVSKIGDYVFHQCYSLAKVKGCKQVQEIGRSVFMNTPWIESVKGYCILGNGILVKANVDTDKAEIPDSVFTIADAFENNQKIKSVLIPDSVKRIDSYCFYGCSGLSEITIPNSVSSLGDYVFSDCVNLETVVLPGSLSQVGINCFKNTKWIHSSDWCIAGNGILFACNLESESVQIPDDVLYVADAFSGKAIRTVSFSDNVLAILDRAFYGCESIIEVQLGKNITSIGKNSFEGCLSLEKFDFNDKLEIIDTDAFRGCETLDHLSFPASLRFIGKSAFWGCESLANVDFNGDVSLITIDEENNNLTDIIK